MPLPTARVLIVEDEPNLRLTLEDNLQAEGYQVTAVPTAQGARDALRRGAFELIILDLMLPDGDGYALCRELRGMGCFARVMMLTARTLEEDLVRGFEAGADDYLAKPYRLRELLARAGALLRRGPLASSEATLRLGELSVQQAARAVVDAGGRPIELTRKEFDLLLFFLRNPERALTRDEILNAVWGPDVVVDAHTVDNFVSNLKRKLQLDRQVGVALKTIRGVGYRLELEGRSGL